MILRDGEIIDRRLRPDGNWKQIKTDLLLSFKVLLV